MNKFDDIFSRKAKEAFENYNADHLADEGWNSFARKYGRRRSRAIVIPLWARAASILILVTAGVLLTARLNNRKAGETVNQIAQETRSEQTDNEKNREDTTATTPAITSPAQAAEATVSQAGQHRQTGRERSSSRVSETAGPVLAEAVKTEEIISSDATKTDGSHLSGKSVAEISLLADTSMAEGSGSHETFLAADISDRMDLPDNPIEIRLTDNTDTRLNLNPKKALKEYPAMPREKLTTTIMTGLSGMIASADNATSTSQGISIGFYVEQQLTRRISVRPGLAMARHNYTVESMALGSLDMAYAAPELSGMAATATTYDADIDVVSMEVPVNFVFSLRKRARSNLFITTGASTVIYLSQNLSGSFNNTYTRSTVNAGTGQVEYESMTTTVQIESEQEFLNRIDLLGLANFSAGYSFPFAGTSQLLFEPFVQMPIRDLTSLNLRIWYGGLSMKIRF
jgi:hypothetical protein